MREVDVADAFNHQVALGAGLFPQRSEFSLSRLATAKAKLQSIPSITRVPGLCIYVTGSYARLEAGPHSDIDLFFLHRGSEQADRCPRLDKYRLFADVIKVAEEMDLPPFSNDGEFLRIQYIDGILKEMGGREDDYKNHFTARMLLLLESSPVLNEAVYDEVIGQIVNSYFRDYPNHAENFRPTFLTNDIIRFWKTLCLNYEHRRNRPDTNTQSKRKQQVKNFKLKFSRMLTCFGTVAAICAQQDPVTPDVITALLKRPPLERLVTALAGPKLEAYRSQIVDQYGWFLEKTALETSELTELFNIKAEKTNMFSRGDEFGSLLFRILQQITRETDQMRFLII